MNHTKTANLPKKKQTCTHFYGLTTRLSLLGRASQPQWRVCGMHDDSSSETFCLVTSLSQWVSNSAATNHPTTTSHKQHLPLQKYPLQVPKKCRSQTFNNRLLRSRAMHLCPIRRFVCHIFLVSCRVFVFHLLPFSFLCSSKTSPCPITKANGWYFSGILWISRSFVLPKSSHLVIDRTNLVLSMRR